MATLYEDLMNLCSGDKTPFFYKDFQKDDCVYRIFNYRLGTYSDFLRRNALNCRGPMFRINVDEPNLVCLPPPKFFNLYENPFTMNPDFKTFSSMFLKEDGSMINTFLHPVDDKITLGLKTKGSIDNEQIALAYKYLEATPKLSADLLAVTTAGWTISLELVSPANRIVVNYPKTTLRAFCMRHRGDGGSLWNIPVKLNGAGFDSLCRHSLGPVQTFVGNEKFVEQIPEMLGIEGYVIHFRDVSVKHKTKWYLTLHHSKDSVNIPRRLFECVINEATDDLKSLFADDPISLNTIKEMEDRVIPKYNEFVSTVEKYHAENKDLIRKDYAIKGQKELGPLFSLGMDMFLQRPADFKSFALKNPKLFGVNENVEVVSVD
jgi:T4 RnlA family RNA ligase